MICSECNQDKKHLIWDCEYVGCDARMCSCTCNWAHESKHQNGWIKTLFKLGNQQTPESKPIENKPAENKNIKDKIPKNDDVVKLFDWNRALDLKYITNFFFGKK